jgi:hypothetical protein
MTRCLALCIIFAPFSAFAATPTVAVVGIHQPELAPEAQAKAVEALVQAIDQTGKAKGMGTEALHTGISGKEEVILREGLLGEGRRLLAEGRNLYSQASWLEAVPVFESAQAALERTLPGSNTTRELWEAWVYLGACHLQMEAPDDATAAFQSAIALSVGREPDAAVFPPDMIAAFDAARAPLQAQATAIEVTGDPSDHALVFLDGESKGTAPLTISSVLPGKHFLNLRAATSTGSAEVYVPPVEGGGTPEPVRVDIPLGAPSLGAAEESAAARGRQNAAYYRALGQQSSVDYVLLAGVDGATLSLQLYSRGNDAFSKVTEVPVAGTADDEAIAAVPLLLGVLAEDGSLPAASTSPTTPPFSIGTNPIVAQLLLEPAKYAAQGNNASSPSPRPDDGKHGNGLLIGGIVGGAAVVGGAVAVTAVLLGGGGGESDGTGTITVGPF